ncbi:hypothetical protein [Allobaculum sp. JKK-2023]|uniref:hypothetical protein n=1 Tax=Allobaculum sp. JKK-2023 TaxID=3108943 RepID=UPI002B05F30A|nr:hypothetical protein [Allobaculum sp. JKK-2023]
MASRLLSSEPFSFRQTLSILILPELLVFKEKSLNAKILRFQSHYFLQFTAILEYGQPKNSHILFGQRICSFLHKNRREYFVLFHLGQALPILSGLASSSLSDTAWIPENFEKPQTNPSLSSLDFNSPKQMILNS